MQLQQFLKKSEIHDVNDLSIFLCLSSFDILNYSIHLADTPRSQLSTPLPSCQFLSRLVPCDALKYWEPLVSFVVLHLLRFLKLPVKWWNRMSFTATNRQGQWTSPHAKCNAVGPSASMSQIKPIGLEVEWYGINCEWYAIINYVRWQLGQDSWYDAMSFDALRFNKLLWLSNLALQIATNCNCTRPTARPKERSLFCSCCWDQQESCLKQVSPEEWDLFGLEWAVHF